jgi:hypothetical protein
VNVAGLPEISQPPPSKTLPIHPFDWKTMHFFSNFQISLPLMDEVVEIHLVIHQGNEELTVDFSFNKQKDDVDLVVSDLLETFGMAPSEKPRFHELIERQIAGSPNPPSAPGAFEPIPSPDAALVGDDYQSDDGDITDAEYRALLEEQRQEMDALVAQHLEERRELAARLKSASSDALLAELGLPALEVPSPVVPFQPGLPSATCDDLIVF